MLLRQAVHHPFDTVEDVAGVAPFSAASPPNALTGQTLVASHGWFMG